MTKRRKYQCIETKKLQLLQQTIRNLNHAELAHAAGGVKDYETRYCPD
ncbi:MAG TPA: hypothetical protein VFT22_37730 [Kofleriaceae bacterium]|nr:hypothetical protein [Kofleriaceae bacterium]